jgi:putative membrane protein
MNLHPLSVLYRAGESVWRLAWVLVILSIGSTQFGTGLQSALGLVAAGLAVALAYQFVYVRRFTYDLTPDTFDIESGVISRRTREIPYGRVQNVDVRRDPIQRILGLAEVRIETAGGGETEARLRFVSPGEADRLQTAIGRRKRGTDTEAGRAAEEPADLLFAISGTELLLLGLVKVDLRLVSAVTVFLPVLVPSLSEVFPLVSLVAVAPILAVLLIGGGLLASSVVAASTYYGFRLTRVEDELRYERGLLQTYSGTIPLDKVQTVALSENVIARTIGYASLAVETAGYAPGEDTGSQSAVPVAERERVVELAREIESFPDVSFEGPPKRARTRYAARYVIAIGVVTGMVYGLDVLWGFPGPWFVPLVLLPLVPVAAQLKWRNLGYALLADHVVTRAGFWNRTTRVVPYYRVQTVVERATVFQRRRNLATVIVDTAGTSGLTGGDARALDIDAKTARYLRDALNDRLQDSLAARRPGRLGA